MEVMNYGEYCDAIRREGHALAAAARAAGIDANVPSCPEWTVADLLGHVGRLHRWVSAIVESRGDDPTDHWSDAEPPPPDARLDWFDAGVDRVADALLGADPETEAWSWTDDRTARWWAPRSLSRVRARCATRRRRARVARRARLATAGRCRAGRS